MPRLWRFQGVGHRRALGHGNQHTVLTAAHSALFQRTIVAEGGGQDTRTGSHGQEGVTETDQTAGRNGVFQAYAALAVRDHVGQVALTQAHLLHHRALVLLLDVDDDILVGLLLLAVNLADHHFRATHGQLEILPAHVLDQNGQVQFAPAGNLELVGGLAFLNSQRDVVQQFFFQTLLDIATGDVFAFLAGERGSH